MSDWFNVRFDQQNVKTNFWVWIYRPTTFSHDMGAILMKSHILRALLLYHIKGHEQDGREGRLYDNGWQAERVGNANMKEAGGQMLRTRGSLRQDCRLVVDPCRDLLATIPSSLNASRRGVEGEEVKL